jgi:hypothetical protein
MDDFIYLIVLIAWVVFAFYRKSQKKSQAARETQRRPEARSESMPFPTLEEILLGKEPAREVEPLPATEPFTTDGMAPELKETAFEREYNRRGITSIEEMDKPFTMKDRKPSDIQEDEVLLENEVLENLKARVDLRQAVIYSEILNRPYV